MLKGVVGKKKDKISIKDILKENERRLEVLSANYNPITGEGCPDERVLLEIPDFAIPKQYVPVDMMNNSLVKQIIKAGSIENFLDTIQDNTLYSIMKLLLLMM